MGECCPPGSIGPVGPPKDYVLKGELIILPQSKGKCYYVAPVGSPSTKAIVMCPDVFGIDSGRTKFLADRYAEQGYHVALVESFTDDAPVNATNVSFPRIICFLLTPSTWSFFKRNDWPSVSKFYDEAFDFLKAKGCEAFGLVGFCWGAYPQTYLCAREDVKASAFFHPSLMFVAPRIGNVSWQTIVKENIRCPIMIAASRNEPAEYKPGGGLKIIMEELEKVGQIPEGQCEFYAYESAHGYMNRGDLKDTKIKTDAEDAFAKSLTFFGKHVSN